MLAGATVFVGGYSLLSPVIRNFGNGGKITLPEATATPLWIWLLLVIILAVIIGKIFPHSTTAFSQQEEDFFRLSQSPDISKTRSAKSTS
jgi:hypothetical protein